LISTSSEWAGGKSRNGCNKKQIDLWLAQDQRAIGVLAVADTIKDGSIEAVREMPRAWLKVIMITGDKCGATGNAIATKVGMRPRAGRPVLPAAKAAAVKALQARRAGRGDAARFTIKPNAQPMRSLGPMSGLPSAPAQT